MVLSFPLIIASLFLLIVSNLVTVVGYWRTVRQQQAFQETPALAILGIFVWGDAVLIGPFWALISLMVLWFQDWHWLVVSGAAFWLIRSLGEVWYWLLQQFSPIERNPPQRLRGYHFFKSDAIWFAYQVFWQIIAVFSLVLLAWLFKTW